MRSLRLLAFNKPYRVLTKFQAPAGRLTLRDFLDAPGCHPAGRLDADSEGLLLLTDVGRWQAALTDPRTKVAKTYYVQVEGRPGVGAVEQLRHGIMLKDGLTAPAAAECVVEPNWLWARDPPIRFRRHIPTSWLRIVLTEGRNRQVRRMTAAVGHPTLRLIRWSVGPWSIEGQPPGAWRELSVAEVDRWLTGRARKKMQSRQ